MGWIRVHAAAPQESPIRGSPSPKRNNFTAMHLYPLLCCLILAGSLLAGDTSAPARFEMRLVQDNATSESEVLSCQVASRPEAASAAEKLNVKKEVLLNRSAIKTATVQANAVNGNPEISITFTESGKARFAQVTREHIGERLAIVVDGQVYSAPKIMSEIAGGKAIITGSFTRAEASALASRLAGGNQR